MARKISFSDILELESALVLVRSVVACIFIDRSIGGGSNPRREIASSGTWARLSLAWLSCEHFLDDGSHIFSVVDPSMIGTHPNQAQRFYRLL